MSERRESRQPSLFDAAHDEVAPERELPVDPAHDEVSPKRDLPVDPAHDEVSPKRDLPVDPAQDEVSPKRDLPVEPAQAEVSPERALPVEPAQAEDATARRFAADPAEHVVLEASAGTGKTSVLVARYLNLLRAGIDPANILAITFTRKAAAEMRERIVRDLRDAAARSASDARLWAGLRDRVGEIAISTIDAFCLSLLREFPLEADVDPGFEMADETEVPRLIEESLDKALREITALAPTNPDMRLVLAQLGLTRAREGLAILLDRRLVARPTLDRFLATGPQDLTASVVCAQAAQTIVALIESTPGGLTEFARQGPTGHPRFRLLVQGLERLASSTALPDQDVRAVLNRVGAHFLTQEGEARKAGSLPPYSADHYPSQAAGKAHRALVARLGPDVKSVLFVFNRDLNAILARGIRRMFEIALRWYRHALEERSVLDFSDVLERALDLLRQMDEFAQSRFRLESRYHHVLVDEFQDTSQAQWELVSLIIRSWGEGLGLASRPSIFIVGDRKQSIYRFRDADVGVMDDARLFIESLRPGSRPRRSIARSFRAVPELLAFVNDVFGEMASPQDTQGGFAYGEGDRFPVGASTDATASPALGVAVADDSVACAERVAAEIARLLREGSVRDRKTGVARRARPGDIGIIFRSRASHRDFERALEREGVPTYVYKGLGFFDADETRDVVALLRFLARPASDLRAAALLRSGFVRLSDRGLAALAPTLADALAGGAPPAALAALDDEDRRVLLHARARVATWLSRADRVPPADLLEDILVESAYAYELRGARSLQAWENLKKMRTIVRRIQNRGYATLPRIADHLDALTAGDEANAVIEALDAVNLMTVHASKGLEFPIVFVVNLAKGASGPPRPVRVIADRDAASVSVGPFVSDVDEGERDHEKHETRRLLYVAFTRARDRLYLATVLKDGQMTAGRGSLGEVIPPALKGLFPQAAADAGALEVPWTGASGRTYRFRVCPAPAGAAAEAQTQAGETAVASPPRFTAHQPPAAPERRIASRPVAAPAKSDLPPQSRVIGRLVHRLFQRYGLEGEPPSDAVLVTPEEVALLSDVAAEQQEALKVWRDVRSREHVRALLASGAAHYEVPFSFRGVADPSVLRGTIDCLLELPDGSVAVLEFKTGAPDPSHRVQLDSYIRAAGFLFPGRRVEGYLVYA